MINIVGGGPGEEKFASSAGLEKCSRFVCLEPNPLFAVNGIPHVTGCRQLPIPHDFLTGSKGPHDLSVTKGRESSNLDAFL